jgi:Zn-dependent oligopeptidase
MGVAAERLLDALQKIRKKRRSIKKIKGINASDSLEKALQTLNKAKETLNAQLSVFDRARITPQDCDESVSELLEIKETSIQFLINNDSKSVANQIIFLYKFEEDILSLVSSIRQFRKISIQTDSEDIKQQIILSTQNLIKDVGSLILKIKG